MYIFQGNVGAWNPVNFQESSRPRPNHLQNSYHDFYVTLWITGTGCHLQNSYPEFHGALWKTGTGCHLQNSYPEFHGALWGTGTGCHLQNSYPEFHGAIGRTGTGSHAWFGHKPKGTGGTYSKKEAVTKRTIKFILRRGWLKMSASKTKQKINKKQNKTEQTKEKKTNKEKDKQTQILFAALEESDHSISFFLEKRQQLCSPPHK